MESPSKEKLSSVVEFDEDLHLDEEQFITKDLLDKLDSDSPVRMKNSKPEFFSAGNVLRLNGLRFGIDVFESEELTRKSTWPEKESSFSPANDTLFSKTPQVRHNNPFYPQMEEFRLSEELEDYWTTQGNRIGWVCSGCQNFNYENRRKCNMCNKQKSSKIVGEKNKNIKKFVSETNTPLPKNAVEEVKKPMAVQGNWECSNCKNINFSFRVSCNRCNLKKQ